MARKQQKRGSRRALREHSLPLRGRGRAPEKAPRARRRKPGESWRAFQARCRKPPAEGPNRVYGTARPSGRTERPPDVSEGAPPHVGGREASGPVLSGDYTADLSEYLAGLVARGCRPATEVAYRKALAPLSRWERLRMDAESLLLRWKDLRPNTRAFYLSALRSFRLWAADRGMDPTPVPRTLRVRLDEPSPRPLAPEAESALWAAARGDRPLLLLLALLRDAGLRMGEALALRWEDVSLPIGKETLTIRAGKGRSDLTIPILPGRFHLADRLRRELRTNGGRDTGPVLLNAWGAAWTYRAALARFQACAKRAGVKATPHQLRHSAGTAWLRAGYSGEIVRRLLRHRNMGMVARYAELSADDLRRAAERTGR